MCLAQGPQRRDAGEARTRYMDLTARLLTISLMHVKVTIQWTLTMNLGYISEFPCFSRNGKTNVAYQIVHLVKNVFSSLK